MNRRDWLLPGLIWVFSTLLPGQVQDLGSPIITNYETEQFDQSIMVADLGLFHAKNHGRKQSIYMKAGPRLPSGEEIIQKTVTSLEFALQEGYLQIEDSSNHPKDVVF